jgi:hypothetical protein
MVDKLGPRLLLTAVSRFGHSLSFSADIRASVSFSARLLLGVGGAAISDRRGRGLVQSRDRSLATASSTVLLP